MGFLAWGGAFGQDHGDLDPWGLGRLCWRFGRLRGGVGLGLQEGFDAGGVEVWIVEQGEGFGGERAGDDVADGEVAFLEVVELVRRQGVAEADPDEVGFGEGGEVSRVVQVGGAEGGCAVGDILRDLAEGAGDFLQVFLQDVGEQRVETGEMFSQGGGGHFHGDGHAGEGDARSAEGGEEFGCRDDDAFLAFDFAGGEVAQERVCIHGVRSEDSVRYFHAVYVSFDNAI